MYMRGGIVVLSGMAFKGQPETSDLRGSSSVYIARKLHDLGYDLILHDFVAKEDDLKALELGRVYSDLESACAQGDVLVVLNNHKKYFDLQENEAITRDGFAILDSWGVCKNLYYNDKINISSLGNLMI